MDKTVITAIIVVSALILGLPILAHIADQDAQKAAQLKAGVTGPDGKAAPVKIEPPYWNNANLGGTTWTLNMRGIAATVTMNPGGTAVAMSESPLVKLKVPSGQLQGTWSIEGDKITLGFTIPDLGSQKITGKISGKQFLDDKGQILPLVQVQ